MNTTNQVISAMAVSSAILLFSWCVQNLNFPPFEEDESSGDRDETLEMETVPTKNDYNIHLGILLLTRP